jgi:FtsP/CotA-like multicopper oxidase with cupredoxin domain
MRKSHHIWLPVLLVCVGTVIASAQSFKVQCPATTSLHPSGTASAPFLGPVQGTISIHPDFGSDFTLASNDNGGAVKCQEVSGGDGYATMADGTQTYLFGFGPLSGLGLIANGQPGTQLADDFNKPYTDGPNFLNGQPNPNYDPKSPNANGAISDVAAIMHTGVMNANMPAPLIAIDEDDELFLTLTNVGMIMRPDLFEQHTIHFHGYPNASSFYDGVPDASVAINIGGSFTYYYLAPDAGTYFWHCHITPPEHLQMGMVGQIYVRPRQDRVPSSMTVYQALVNAQSDLRIASNCSKDILCSTPLPVMSGGDNSPYGGYANGTATKMYAYNDGDGSTRYDHEYPIQIHGFDPNFHFVGMTFNPEGFADMKDKYFLLNGRSYPDTVNTGGNWDPSYGTSATPALYTQVSDGTNHPSQPLPTFIQLKQGERALLRISDLDVTEFQTLASVGIPMQVIALNARLLRDEAGNNMYYNTNSITLGGGESLDVILDTCTARGPAPDYACTTKMPTGKYFLYTPQLDHLSNDAENFGGLMTEVDVTN